MEPTFMLAGRTQVNGVPTVCVFENYTCQLAVTDPTALAEQPGCDATI